MELMLQEWLVKGVILHWSPTKLILNWRKLENSNLVRKDKEDQGDNKKLKRNRDGLWRRLTCTD